MTRGRIVAAAYVAAVAGLTAVAFSSHQTVRWAQVAAALLTLPTVLAALPVIYLAGAYAWTFADSPSGGSSSSGGPSLENGPIWPVTLTFTVVMTLVACVNVALAAGLLRSLRRAPATGPGQPPSRRGTPP